MEAPEDNINFNKKSSVYENKTYKNFESLLRLYKYWDLVAFFTLLALTIAAQGLTPYLIDTLLFFESEDKETFLTNDFFEVYGHVVFTVVLLISSYQIYKSIVNRKENQNLGIRFYLFQSLKIFIYIWSSYNLLLFFAIVALLRIAVVIYFSQTKSFK